MHAALLGAEDKRLVWRTLDELTPARPRRIQAAGPVLSRCFGTSGGAIKPASFGDGPRLLDGPVVRVGLTHGGAPARRARPRAACVRSFFT